jgi:hypothetical protein
VGNSCSHRGKQTRFAYTIAYSSALSGCQGLLGSLLIKMNAEVAVYRRNSQLYEWPVLEVVGGAAVTAALSYLVRMRRVLRSVGKDAQASRYR